MAVGDVVNGISGANAILDFQPAAGVECVITCTWGLLAGGQPLLYNGSNQTNAVNTATESPLYWNVKIFINNTNYLRIPAQGAGTRSGYTGLQTK